MDEMERIFNEIAENARLTRKTILRFLKHNDTLVIKGLMHEADSIRKKYMGSEVHIRAIIEFSNWCDKDCVYCGIRKSNKEIERYRLSIDEIYDTACELKECGYKTVILQSGEDGYYDTHDIAELVRRIKEDLNVAVTLSVGELPMRDLRKLRDAGADRYLLKFETSDKKLYQWLKPDGNFERRIRCLKDLKELGFQVGSGIMVGLPGQTQESLADDIMLFDELGLDMIGIGPFIPHPETPLKNTDAGNIDNILRVIALTRILTLNTHIPATTALGTISHEGRKRALMAGANVIMINATPLEYREKYEIYPNRTYMGVKPQESLKSVERMLSSIGRIVGKGYGHGAK